LTLYPEVFNRYLHRYRLLSTSLRLINNYPNPIFISASRLKHEVVPFRWDG